VCFLSVKKSIFKNDINEFQSSDTYIQLFIKLYPEILNYKTLPAVGSP